MYCSTCGALVPDGRRECATCGSTIGSYERVLHSPRALETPFPQREAARLPRSESEPAIRGDVGAAAGSGSVHQLAPRTTCPRCEYEGQGIPYFNRGSHLAGLIAVTILTLPGGIGAGGILYYWLRRNHTICPRCGYGWGKHSIRALPVPVERPRYPVSRPELAASPGGGEGAMRVWSIILLLLAALALGLGVAELEAVLLVIGAVFAGGGLLLHRGATAARQKRREALLASLQLNVLRLAGERDGRLTVTEVAAALAWPIRRAEKVLHSLDDGWRVNSEVTDEGVIVYEFRELLARGDSEGPLG